MVVEPHCGTLLRLAWVSAVRGLAAVAPLEAHRLRCRRGARADHPPQCAHLQTPSRVEAVAETG